MIPELQFTLRFTIVILLFTSSQCQNAPLVKTRYGELEGRSIETVRGTVNAWLGIPYAAPPTGSARFQLPSRPSPWLGRRPAIQFGPRCPQMPMYPVKYGESENCLFLNVFSPAETNSQGYPVMFWVHGGGFLLGSADQFGTDGIAENLVSRGVVVVTINYRLAAFGFFAVDQSDVTGNYALHDAIEALRWVRENIKDFGGNPNRVTIFGESAGGAMVSLLNHIPNASSLFHQVISQSGSAFAQWAVTDSSVRSSSELIKRLNCSSSSLNDTMECVRAVSTETMLAISTEMLIEAAQDVTSYLNAINQQNSWGPRIDGLLFPENLDDLVEASPSRPFINGICQEEILIFAKPINSISRDLAGTLEISNDSNITREYIRKQLSMGLEDKNHQEILTNLGVAWYLDLPTGDVRNETFRVQQFIKLVSDVWFNYPSYADANNQAKKGGPTWAYVFDYYSPQLPEMNEQWKMSSHEMELPFLFHSDIDGKFPIKFDENDTKIVDLMGTLWTNFAKFGNPTPEPVEGVKWEQFTEAFPNNLHISLKLKMDDKFLEGRPLFWSHVVPTVESGTNKLCTSILDLLALIFTAIMFARN